MVTNASLIATILGQSRTIAVVGLSDKSNRPSHDVAQYLQRQGYRIVPVNPACAGLPILGERCFASLTDAASALARDGHKIDVVNCFRRSDAIPPIVDEATSIGAPYLWMQLGVSHEEAAQTARAAGIGVVMDHCIKIDHARWLAETRRNS